MGGVWKVLGLDSSSTSSPPLAVKHEVASSGYTIHVSDLTNVWTERMNARDIRKRALNADTSIDPSEDHEQMRLFLRCINDALEQKPGTSVELAYDESAERLLLKTFTPLPGSLEPLRWTVEMRNESPFVFTKEMVLPLLCQQANRNAECASLIQQLKDKDHVIDKLVDTIQADSISLSKIFPGAAPVKSGSRSDPRQTLSKSVKGFSGFDEQEWRKSLKRPTAQQSSLGGLISTVFPSGACHDEEVLPLLDYGEWWLRLNGKRLHQAQTYFELHPPQEESQASKGGSQFKKQVTPPTLRHTAPEQVPEQTPEAYARPMDVEKRQTTSTKRDLDDSTTEDEDDLAASKTHETTESVPESNRSRRETINNGLTSRPKDKEKESTPTKPSADLTDPNAKSSSNVENPTNSKPSHNPNPHKQKSKIGRIGGKPKPIPNPSPPVDSSHSIIATNEQTNLAQRQESPHPNPTSPSLTTEQFPPAAASPAEGGTPLPPKRASPSPSPTPAETEIERADRNRAQIKRALEAKAAAPATKKKRRF